MPTDWNTDQSCQYRVKQLSRVLKHDMSLVMNIRGVVTKKGKFSIWLEDGELEIFAIQAFLKNIASPTKKCRVLAHLTNLSPNGAQLTHCVILTKLKLCFS